jgi:lipopolysaccharide/colanic/teichoic acid biosynthesis glycosyltransferase
MDMRRAVDITVAVLAMPLVFAVAAVWATQYRSPIFYQTRIGLNGQPFRIMKFRTISEDTSLPLDRRIPRVAHIMRSIGADELLQFINILRSEMSMIGPRPMMEDAHRTGQVICGKSEWDKRLQIRSGLVPPTVFQEKLTGRGCVDLHERLATDLAYIDKRRTWRILATDLRLLWAAVRASAAGRIDPQARIPDPSLQHSPHSLETIVAVP